jgi:tetratricopeptide (TPR) repeat protein
VQPSPARITPKVLISYSHDSPAHMDRVLELADRLRKDGIDAILDQYETAPSEGWPKWVDRQIEEANFVLIVCTEAYFNRVRGTEKPETGRGVKWESLLTYQDIYDNDSLNSKHIPVLLGDAEELHIPRPLRATDRYVLTDEQEYEKLYRRITGQPLVVKPELGTIRSLPPRQRQPAFKPAHIWNVPHERNPVFTGRTEILEALRADLQKNKRQALSGLGGIGKTQIAVEYANRYRDEYTVVFWTFAGSEQSVNSGFSAIAKLLDLPQKDSAEQSVITSAVKRWFDENDDWLLVFDNADHPEILPGFLPQQRRGHVLLTSRAHVFQKIGVFKPQEVPILLPSSATEFLLKRTGREGQQPSDLDALAKELGYFPLALEQAGAYIVENEVSFSSYLLSFRKRRLELFDKQKPIIGNYKETVTTTWDLNFTEIENFPASADLLRMSAFLAPQLIPLDLLRTRTTQLDGALAGKLAAASDDPLLLDELLKPLMDYSLVHRDVEGNSYSIHLLVQEVVRERMPSESRKLWAERAISVMNSVFPDAEEFANWPLCERLIAHALACMALIRSYQLESEQAGRLLNYAGRYLDERAQYAEAESLLQRALDIRERILGPDHPDTATSLSDLARLCQTQGKYEPAKTLNERALAVREKILGPEHPDTATSLNNLAGLYQDQGRYAEAEPLYRRALEIKEKALGPEHPNTGTSLNNLALLYDNQGRYAEAELLCRRALEITEKALGPEHPDTAMSLNNLAGLCQDQGRHGEAEPLLRRALAISEKALGPEHPDTTMSLNNLAMLYQDQGRLGEAEPLLRRALEIREKVLGPDHPDTAMSLNNLAGLCEEQGRHVETEPLYKRALEIREKALGLEHPDTVTIFSNLANFYSSRGNKVALRALQEHWRFKTKSQRKQKRKTKKKPK